MREVWQARVARRGSFTMAYDQGLEIRFAGWRYTAFFKYEFEPSQDLPFLSFCHETGTGWSFHDQFRLPGCRPITGRRLGNDSTSKISAPPHNHSADPSWSPSPSDATFASSDGKTKWQPLQGRSLRTPTQLMMQQQQIQNYKILAQQTKGGGVVGPPPQPPSPSRWRGRGSPRVQVVGDGKALARFALALKLSALGMVLIYASILEARCACVCYACVRDVASSYIQIMHKHGNICAILI